MGKGKRKKCCPFFCMYYFPCTRGSFVYQEDSVVEISPNGIPNFFCKCISEANSLFFFFFPLMHSHYMCLFLMHSAVENVLIICASFRVFFFLLLLFFPDGKRKLLKDLNFKTNIWRNKSYLPSMETILTNCLKRNFEGKTI